MPTIPKNALDLSNTPIIPKKKDEKSLVTNKNNGASLTTINK